MTLATRSSRSENCLFRQFCVWGCLKFLSGVLYHFCTKNLVQKSGNFQWKLIFFNYVSDEKGETALATTHVTETHLVILFDNQLDRMIKIVPSRSSRGKYYVDPRAYLLVNITIDSQVGTTSYHY